MAYCEQVGWKRHVDAISGLSADLYQRSACSASRTPTVSPLLPPSSAASPPPLLLVCVSFAWVSVVPAAACSWWLSSSSVAAGRTCCCCPSSSSMGGRPGSVLLSLWPASPPVAATLCQLLLLLLLVLLLLLLLLPVLTKAPPGPALAASCQTGSCCGNHWAGCLCRQGEAACDGAWVEAGEGGALSRRPTSTPNTGSNHARSALTGRQARRVPIQTSHAQTRPAHLRLRPQSCLRTHRPRCPAPPCTSPATPCLRGRTRARAHVHVA
jgi:hypothetical protein